MKRHWKILTMIGVVLLGFGGFYGFQAVTATQTPQVVLQTKEGDLKEIKPFAIDADLSYGGLYEEFTYHAGETRTKEDYSFLERLDRKHNWHDTIVRYQQDYPSFLRGKSLFIDYFTESDAYVLYADAPYLDSAEAPYLDSNGSREISAELLNKETGETMEWTLTVPVDNPRGRFSIIDSYIGEDTIHFLVNQQTTQHDAFQDDIVVYEFDLQTEEVSFSRSLTSLANQGESPVMYVAFYPDATLTYNRRFVPFHISREDGYFDESESADDAREVFVYDFEEKSVSSFVPEETVPSKSQTMIQKDRLYFHTLEGDTFEIHLYDMASGSFTKAWTLDAGEYAEAYRNGYSMKVDHHNRLYMLNRLKTSERNAFLLVFDLDTEERMYAGEVALENEPQGMYELYFDVKLSESKTD